MAPLNLRCPTCSGPWTSEDRPARCPWCGADWADEPPPVPAGTAAAEPFILEDEPEAVPLPDDALVPSTTVDVPVVRPRARAARIEDLPEARPMPRTLPNPEPRRPEPHIALALLVLAAMIVAVGCAITVIVAAFWMGFQSVTKPKKSAQRPPCEHEFRQADPIDNFRKSCSPPVIS